MILNEYDVAFALEQARHPNLLKSAAILARLVEWTNNNSDGWPYWAKPANASSTLQQAVRVRTSGLVNHAVLRADDISDAQLKGALIPIKSFLTRQGVAADVKRKILGEAA